MAVFHPVVGPASDLLLGAIAQLIHRWCHSGSVTTRSPQKPVIMG
jgi:hypothetical protein